MFGNETGVRVISQQHHSLMITVDTHCTTAPTQILKHVITDDGAVAAVAVTRLRCEWSVDCITCGRRRHSAPLPLQTLTHMFSHTQGSRCDPPSPLVATRVDTLQSCLHRHIHTFEPMTDW